MNCSWLTYFPIDDSNQDMSSARSTTWAISQSSKPPKSAPMTLRCQDCDPAPDAKQKNASQNPACRPAATTVPQHECHAGTHSAPDGTPCRCLDRASRAG